VSVYFQISLHEKDRIILESIQSYFEGAGSIKKHSENALHYKVGSLPELTNIILPHFKKYPLITQKMGDFILFKKAIDVIKLKEHLTTEGLKKLVSIKASIN